MAIWRWKRGSEVIEPAELEHKITLSDAAGGEGEHELHGEPVPPSELHGISNGPLELEDGVAAVEKDASKRGRYELYG